MEYHEDIIEKLAINILNNIEILSTHKFDYLDFNARAKYFAEIKFNIQLGQELFRNNQSIFFNPTNLDYFESKDTENIDDYADIWGYSIDEIADGLDKDPSEIDKDDIDNFVGR
jgi:hypothetical protein